MRELLEACGLCFNMIGNRFRLAADQNENPLCNNICKQRTKRIATKCEIAAGTLIAERLPSRP